MTIAVTHVVASDRYAGVEAHVRTLACGQADAGLEVTVFGGDPDRMGPELAAHSVRFTSARTTLELARMLRTVRTDIVHTHMTAAEVAAVGSLSLSRQATTPAIVTTRHFAAPRGSSTLRRPLLAVLADRISAQISASEYIAREIGEPSTVVHAGVPHEPLTPVRARKAVVTVVSRLQPEKHVDVAVSAFARSNLAGLGWRLDIIGGGSEAAALRAQAAALGIARNVQFHGHVSDVPARMASSSILFAPNPVEPFGIAVVEAMSGGLPVVASGGGGHLETVGAVADPALFTPGDLEGAATLLRSLALDPDLRSTYGEQLRATQRASFTVERQLELTSQVYRSVL